MNINLSLNFKLDNLFSRNRNITEIDTAGKYVLELCEIPIRDKATLITDLEVVGCTVCYCLLTIFRENENPTKG